LLKKCSVCKTEKPLDAFSKHRCRRDGFNSSCRVCRSKADKAYSTKHKEKIKAYLRDYYQKNKQKAKEYQIKNKERRRVNKKNWDLKNKEHVRQYIKTKWKNNPAFRIGETIRIALRQFLKNPHYKAKQMLDIGCTAEELKYHIEKQFEPGMTWDNWGYYGWHLDHKIPLSHFDLTIRAEYLKACNFANIQPLWREVNKAKSNKLIKEKK